ncbi:MAG TPA: hypothetical protein VM689_11690 [Aliidongia sp.]|nr:hypothetical protein [Aliidongia sp.]
MPSSLPFRRSRPNVAAITEPAPELAQLAALDQVEAGLAARHRATREREQALAAERRELAGPALLADDPASKKRLLAIRGEIAAVGSEVAEIEDALAALGAQRADVNASLARTCRDRALSEARELAERYVAAADAIDGLLSQIAVHIETCADSAQALGALKEHLGGAAPVTARLVGDGLLQQSCWHASAGTGIFFGARRRVAIGAAEPISVTARRVLGHLIAGRKGEVA